MPLSPDRNGIVHIGNARGKIALYLDESEAIDMAERLYPGDGARDELMAAVEAAYPAVDDDAPTLPGLRVVVTDRRAR